MICMEFTTKLEVKIKTNVTKNKVIMMMHRKSSPSENILEELTTYLSLKGV